jgi:hypothetical protein
MKSRNSRSNVLRLSNNESVKPRFTVKFGIQCERNDCVLTAVLPDHRIRR